MVNRANKRSQTDAGLDLPDPTEFVDQYCRQRNLVEENIVGTTELEKRCIRSAEEARQHYKDHRDDELERRGAPVPRTDDNQAPGGTTSSQPPISLSPAQKYSRRLFNNRKSAAAAKVYQDVLKRELATVIQNLQNSVGLRQGMDGVNLLDRVAELEQQVTRFEDENAKLQRQLAREEKRVYDLTEQARKSQLSHVNVKRMLSCRKFIANESSQKDDAALRVFIDSQQQLPLTSQDLELVQNLPSQNQFNSQLSADPRAFLSDGGSQQASQPVPTSAGFIAGNTLRYSSSMALSQVANEGDAKDFTTGLTCSQSQRDEGDDVLARASHPLSAGLPIGLLGSQQSQELPGFKTPIGSEENPLGEDGFFISSQGTTKGA